jgi:hypothetical protein
MKSVINYKSKSSCINRKLSLLLIFLIFIGESQISCRKFIQAPLPPGTITENSVYRSDATAIAVLNSIYNEMNTNPIQGIGTSGSISIFAGLSADEFALVNGVTIQSYVAYYTNSLSQSGVQVSGGENWAPLYSFIFQCNAAIEGVNSSSSLTPAVKQQLLGEAKFMRAFYYFYLVNLYGDVPLVLATDPAGNTNLARSSKIQVYQQIITDLLDAEDKLSNDYLDVTLLNTSSERVRPTKWAAKALLARVYLFNGNLTGDVSNYANAETKATEVINNSTLYTLLPSLNDVFLKNSRETILQVQPTSINFNTLEAQVLVIQSTGPLQQTPVILNKLLLNSFEPDDQRAILGNWINRTIYNSTPTTKDTAYYPFKYKLNTSDATITSSTGTKNMKEYFMVLRLAEQYLIRSEARARQGNIGGAESDLNAIRHRAGLGDTPANDQASLITAILNERRHELFSEWGYRWLDLKRTGTVDAVMTIATPLKSNGIVQWQSYQQLYPIPLTEIQSAPNLKQNTGY